MANRPWRGITRNYAGGGKYDQILLWSYDKSLEQIFADDDRLGISNLIYAQSKYHSRRRYAREKYQKLMQIARSGRLLIILDNYNKMEDPWFDALREIPCDLLVTTRLGESFLSELGYAVLAVESFSREEDWQEFYRLYTGKEPEGPEWEATEAYRESVLGHTLKMKLALCNPGQRWTSGRLAKSVLANFRLKKAEIQILCELSYVTLRGIPEEVYLSCTKEDQNSLNTLKTYSLVQERTDRAGQVFLFLHPVIREAVQTVWRPNLTRCFRFVEAFSVYARFSRYRPRENDFWLVPQVFALLERLPEPVAWRYELYESLATCLFVWEYFDEAEQMMRVLYECVKSYYGEGHQHTAYMALRMAGICYGSMRFGESREWYELSCRLYGEAEPADNGFYAGKADACSGLARICGYEGEYGTAHGLLDTAVEAMEDFRRNTREADPVLWRLRRRSWQYASGQRAWLYFRQGDLDAAQRELDAGMRMFPMNEFQRVEVGRLQARLYFARREYGRARDAVMRDLELCARYQGESVKVTMSCRELLGDILWAMGEIQAADEEYLRVFNSLRDKYPHQKAWIRRLQKKLGDAGGGGLYVTENGCVPRPDKKRLRPSAG